MTKKQFYTGMALSLCAFWGFMGFMLWEVFK
jgi:hypothetical protein